MASPILIIGYGNPLRKDDGVGRYLVEHLPPQTGVKVLSVHQLTPELVTEMAEAKYVIFVDVIASSQQSLEIQPLSPLKPSVSLGHTCSPPYLLFLTQTLYDYVPQAWWVLIPGEDFTFGETFSPLTQSFLPVALQAIQKLMDRCLQN